MTHLNMQILSLVCQKMGVLFREDKQSLNISCSDKSICQGPASQCLINQVPANRSKEFPLSCEDF